MRIHTYTYSYVYLNLFPHKQHKVCLTICEKYNKFLHNNQTC